MKAFGLSDIPALTTWLEGQKAAMLVAPTNEWEALRFRVADARGVWTTGIIYKNKKGRLKFQGQAQAVVTCFLEGGELKVYPAGPPPAPPTGSARRVRLYTDASYRAKTKTGAWGAVLVYDGNRKKEASGPLKDEVSSSTLAEARGVANGLHHFLREKLIRPGDHVTVICDNTAVISRLNGHNRSAKRPEIGQAIALVQHFAAAYELELVGFWIEGHLPLSAGEDAVHNRRCDKLAGEHGLKLHRQRAPKMKINTGEEARP